MPPRPRAALPSLGAGGVHADAVDVNVGQRLDRVADRLGLLLLEARQERPVERAAREQLVVRALVDHPAAFEHDDAVGQVQRRPAVRDRAAWSGPAMTRAEGVVNGRLDPGVDRAGGVVEDEDARVEQDGPGQRDPLTLAAREGQPALADDGVVAPRQLLDELVGLRRPGRRLDLARRWRRGVRRRCWRAPMSEKRKLSSKTHADLAAQRVQRHVAHVVPVDPDATPRSGS